MLLKSFSCQNKWYFASYWSIVLKSYIFYPFLIIKKSYILLASKFEPMSIEKQSFLLLLQIFCLHYNLVYNLLFLSLISSQLILVPLFYSLCMFDTMPYDYKKALLMHLSCFLYILLSFLSFDPWFYPQTNSFI